MYPVPDTQTRRNLIREQHQIRRALDRNDKFMGLNKLILLACILPFLHLAGCVGQSRKVPTISKIGSVGFVTACVVATHLSKREDDLYQKMTRVQQELSRC